MARDKDIEALSWTDNAWSFEQVHAGLSDFDIEMSPGSLRNLFVALGISPAIRLKPEGVKRGQFGFYDPLVCWVLAVAKHRASGSVENAAQRLSRYRKVAERAGVRGKRIESVAYQLFVSDVDHGVDIRTLHRWVDARPEVLTYTLDGETCLEAVLRAYAVNVIAKATGATVEPEKTSFFGGGRPALYRERFPSTDTLEILDSFGYLKANDKAWPVPAHQTAESSAVEHEHPPGVSSVPGSSLFDEDEVEEEPSTQLVEIRRQEESDEKR